MLVEKKTPGKFRLVVDNRLVNADCKPPVGAMSASPLGINRMMNGAKNIYNSRSQECFLLSIISCTRSPLYSHVDPLEVQVHNLRECQWVQKPQWQRSIKQ